MSSDAAEIARPDATLKQRILHGYCVRVHMTMIVTAVVASGVLSSKLLLLSGIHSLRLRYAIAVAASYGIFLLLVRIWIWYVTLRSGISSKSSSTPGSGSVDFGNLPSPGRWSGGGGGVRFGGGSSGGGGASDTWGEAGESLPARAAGASSGHGGFFSNLDLGSGGDDDGVLVMVLLVALVVSIFCAGGYLVYAAPQILPEAACQAVLAPALLRVSKEHHHGWMSGVLRSTVLPFALVCIGAVALGWSAHRHCPTAVRLMEVWSCPAPATAASPDVQ